MFSGGVGSWATAKRVAAEHGTEDLVLLFADTKMEDEDLYRFVREAAVDVGGRWVTVTEGRDPWEVFFDERFLGNTRIDPCSKILKRLPLRRWIKTNCDPTDTVVYLGISWDEAHRFEAAQKYWDPWVTASPLLQAPYLTKTDHMNALAEAGITPPQLYTLGFPHNNCGGFCIKAGQAQFKLLYETMPDRYQFHEIREEQLRQHLGADVAILRDRTGGATKPMTLRTFRERLETGAGQCDMFEWGGCGCFTPLEYPEGDQS